jgi:hypothetical protein
LAVGIAAGIAKELWDKKHPPYAASLNDVAATATGAILIFSLHAQF